MTGKALIIGYGNPLRGDDGIGQAAAQALAQDATFDCTHVIGCHQLTPELAECIAAVDLVVFVDAAADIQPGVVVVREIQGTSTQSSGLVHTADPAALLDLTRKLYRRTPEAFLVTVGVQHVGAERRAVGEPLRRRCPRLSRRYADWYRSAWETANSDHRFRHGRRRHCRP